MLCHLNLATIPGCGQPDFGHNPANTLQVGMVLTYAVSECTPRPGYWDCYTLSADEPAPQALDWVAQEAPTSMLRRRCCLGWGGGNSEELPWQPRPKCFCGSCLGWGQFGGVSLATQAEMRSAPLQGNAPYVIWLAVSVIWLEGGGAMPRAPNLHLFASERRPRGGRQTGTKLVEVYFQRTRATRAPDADVPSARTDVRVLLYEDGSLKRKITIELEYCEEEKGARPWLFFRWWKGPRRVKTYLLRPAAFYFGTRAPALRGLSYAAYEKRDPRTKQHMYEPDHTSTNLPGCEGSVLTRTLEVVTRAENERRAAERQRADARRG